ncbi:MAG TPA: EAL domain-containing protein [Acidimicrobiales bacterium]|nr:EAL domain-containing protein [Acidimicrobiales bacterium]
MPPRDDSVLEGHPVLQFQPAVDLISGRLLGFEALVRWEHPKRGLIAPDVLLPWAEKTGYIGTLNAWVLSEACRQAAGWPSAVQVAVNGSPTQLRQRRMSISASDALRDSGLNPDRLTVEVKEATIADGLASDDLHALTRLGVHLAVDNVGISWSTLGNLRSFAIDTAKIDREFISALEASEGVNRAIAQSIIRVSQSLGISTVAEGVETAEQVVILRELGAEVGQGYYFAHPLPSDDAHAMANAEPRTVFSLPAPGQTAPGAAAGASVDSVQSSRNVVVTSADGTQLEPSKVHVL